MLCCRNLHCSNYSVVLIGCLLEWTALNLLEYWYTLQCSLVENLSSWGKLTEQISKHCFGVVHGSGWHTWIHYGFYQARTWAEHFHFFDFIDVFQGPDGFVLSDCEVLCCRCIQWYSLVINNSVLLVCRSLRINMFIKGI